MRAKEFIIESGEYEDAYVQPDERAQTDGYITKLAQEIRQACGPFIQANHAEMKANNFMYRGVKGAQTSDMVIKGSVRTDRYPRDTPTQWHEVLDQFFLKQFGTKYRSASLFATNDVNNTYDYGVPYIIFPVGNYKMCYSPIIEDVTVDLSGGLSTMQTKLSPTVQIIINDIPDDEIERIATSLDLPIKDSIDLTLAIRDFSLGKKRTDTWNGYGDYVRRYDGPNFPTMLVDFILPKLQYRETAKFYDANDSEIMIDCQGYYGVRSTRNSPAARDRLLDMILS